MLAGGRGRSKKKKEKKITRNPAAPKNIHDFFSFFILFFQLFIKLLLLYTPE